MRAALPLVAALAMATGCAGPVERAEEQYQMVAENGLSRSDQCAAAHRVRDAALEAGDEDAYRTWTITAYNDCAAAERQPR